MFGFKFAAYETALPYLEETGSPNNSLSPREFVETLRTFALDARHALTEGRNGDAHRYITEGVRTVRDFFADCSPHLAEVANALLELFRKETKKPGETPASIHQAMPVSVTVRLTGEGRVLSDEKMVYQPAITAVRHLPEHQLIPLVQKRRLMVVGL